MVRPLPARLLVAASVMTLLGTLVGASKPPYHATFCTDCKWEKMDFTCGFRVKYLVEHWDMKEEEARQSLLDQGDCLPMADQDQDATPASGGAEAEGSDVISESEEKPELSVNAVPSNSGKVQLASHEGVETSAVSASDKKSSDEPPRQDGRRDMAFLTAALLVLAAVVAVEQRRRKGLEKKLEQFKQYTEETLRQYRDKEVAPEGGGKGYGMELPGQVC